MFFKQLFAQKNRNLLTIIATSLSICLIFVVSVICQNLSDMLYQQLNRMGLDVMMIQVVDNSINENWTDEYNNICRYYSKSNNDYDIIYTDYLLNEQFLFDYLYGDFFSYEDQLFNNNVVVIGSKVYEKLNEPEIASTIFVDGINFTLVGVIAENENNVLIDTDNSIYIPIEYKCGIYQRSYYSQEEITDIPFSEAQCLIVQQKQVKQSFESLINIFAKVLNFLSSFSLFIAFIGIVNNSLSNIKLRIKEISIKKVLGANDKQLFLEIMMENLALITISLIIGILISFMMVRLLDDSLKIDYLSFIKKIIVILILSLVCGIIPAIQSGKTSIMESLK